MKPALWERVSAKFLEALDLTEGQRVGFMATLASEQAEVAEEVASLLKAHGTIGDFLEEPLADDLLSDALTNGPVRDFPLGAKLGGYELVRVLGKGAFATVYLARELRLGRLIALKVSLVRGHEARTMASLEHDHIVRVFSEQVDLEYNVRLICMQYIAGASLRRIEEVVRVGAVSPLTGLSLVKVVDGLCPDPPAYDPVLARERLQFEGWTYPEAVAWLGACIATALEHAHRVGVLHLDVKPDNILISPYARPFLADFNVSLSQDPADVGEEQLGGTFSYMAPEHRRAYKVGTAEAFRMMTPQTDVYSLGVVLFELLTGKHPKARDVEILDETAMQPEARELRVLLERCLVETPADRYESAGVLAKRLEGFLGLLKLRRALPEPGLIARITKMSLLIGLTLFITAPQATGSLVNIAYNASRIVSVLTPEQRLVFERLLWVLNPIFYGVGIAIVVAYVMPLHKFMRNARGDLHVLGDDERATLRQRALHLPEVVSMVTTGCWICGCIAFPVGIHIFGGALPAAVFVHFGISFFLSWIVALTYSFLYVQFAVVGVIYPQLLLGDEDSQGTATRELAGVSGRLQLFQALAGLIPLLAATMLLGADSLVPMQNHFDAYRWLLIGLIASGIIGFLVALRASTVLGRIIFALTSGEPTRR